MVSIMAILAFWRQEGYKQVPGTKSIFFDLILIIYLHLYFPLLTVSDTHMQNACGSRDV